MSRLNSQVCISLLFLIFLACKTYPNKHKEQANYQAVRMEGLTLKQGLSYALPYMKKYWFKNKEKQGYKGTEFPNYQAMNDSFDGIILIFVGDIMWMRNPKKLTVDSALLHCLNEADLLVGNLETPISKKHPIKFMLPDYAQYNDNTLTLEQFKRKDNNSSFNALSLANNHAMDQGIEGLKASIDYLDSIGIEPMGVAVNEPAKLYHSFIRKGIRIGIYAGGWGLNNPTNLNHPQLGFNLENDLLAPIANAQSSSFKALQQMQKDSVHLRIVFLHWGHEFELYPDSLIRAKTSALAAAGANLIIGSHPHVIQPVEYISNATQTDSSLVFYSLGNFCSMMYTKECKTGMIARIGIEMNANKNLKIKALKPAYVYTQKSGFLARKSRLKLTNRN